MKLFDEVRLSSGKLLVDNLGTLLARVPECELVNVTYRQSDVWKTHETRSSFTMGWH